MSRRDIERGTRRDTEVVVATQSVEPWTDLPHLGGLLEVELLPCAEDVVDKPVEGEARGDVKGEPA